MLITSCGCDIVAGETSDPTNALGEAGRRAQSDDGRVADCSRGLVRSPCMCIAEETEFRETRGALLQHLLHEYKLNSSKVSLPACQRAPNRPRPDQPHQIPSHRQRTPSISASPFPPPPPHHRLPANIWGSPSVSHGYLPGLTQMPRGRGHTRPIENAGHPCSRHLGRACAVV